MLCDDKSMKECWSKAEIYTVKRSISYSNVLEALGNKTKLISLVGPEEKLIIVAIYQDPLKEEMATHSSVLAWEIPWTEKPGGLQFIGLQKSRRQRSNETTTTMF